MQVKEILERKGREVATVSQSRTVADALALLRERGIGALVVSGAETPIAGIFSERDAVRAIAVHGASALAMSVSEFMSAEVTTCTESTTVDRLMEMMTEHRIRHVPVADEGQLTGMISIGDVVKWRVEDLERDKRELIDYVSAR